MIIYATGDNHVDERSPRWQECLEIHDWIATRVEQDKPDLFLDGGDVYERASTPTERLVAAEFFRRIGHVCQPIVCRGNHDALHDVLLLSKIAAPFPVKVVESSDVLGLFDGTAVACMAWPARASALDETAAKDAIRNVLRELGDRMAEAPHRILLGHFDVSGAKVGNGQPLVGGGLTVTLADLALAGAQATICSHIHQAQSFEFNGSPIILPGSPFRHDFGESEAKSITRLRFEGGHLVEWDRIPTPARPMLLFEADWDPALHGLVLRYNDHGILITPSPLEPPRLDAAAVWIDFPFLEDVKRADIRLRYRFAPEHQEAAKARAQEWHDKWLSAGAASVKLDPEVIATVRARAPEVAQARTLEDKLQAYWEARGDVPEPEVASRLLGRLAKLQEDRQ